MGKEENERKTGENISVSDGIRVYQHRDVGFSEKMGKRG